MTLKERNLKICGIEVTIQLEFKMSGKPFEFFAIVHLIVILIVLFSG